MPEIDRYPQICHGARNISTGLHSNVYHGPDFHAGVGHINRCLVTGIIVCEHRTTSARGNGVTMNIGTHSRGKHDARCVISVKDQRTFDSTRGEHNLLGPDPPKPFTRYRGIGRHRPEMVRSALVDGEKIMIVIASDSRTAEDGDLGK